MRLGNTDISSVKLGSSQVQAVYLGNNLVWQNAPTAIAATGVGTTSFTANWEAYSGATYYLLDVSESSDFSTFVYENQVVIAPTTSYVVIGLNSNTTYYYRVRASDDTDGTDFFTRVNNAGGTLTSTEQIAIINLVQDLKDYGIWTKMKAIYPMVGASAAACAQNLKSSSFTGTFNGGITYSSTGITGNGTTGYMNTGLAPSSNLSLNSTHLSFYSRTSTSGGESEMGTSQGLTNRTQITLSFNTICYNAVNNGVTQFSNTLVLGFFIANRVVSNQMKTFRNGIAINTQNANSQGLHTGNIALLAINDSSGVVQYSSKECAFASIGDGLTDTEASNLYTAVQAFQTTLSREV